MTVLKQLPISYKGELHEVILLNFSVDKQEVAHRVPKGLQVADYKGRALISMVNVHLRNMHPTFAKPLKFHYQHIGFRLLIDDRRFTGEDLPKGIFFLDSFTNRPLLAKGGSLLTYYNLQNAQLHNTAEGLEVQQQGQFLSYNLMGPHQHPQQLVDLQHQVGNIDRAYAIDEGIVRMTQIQREKWPLKAMACQHFHTSFFETARFEGAFKVPETIYYQWLPAREVKPCA